MNSLCTSVTSYNFPRDVFDIIWKKKQQLESIDHELDRSSSMTDFNSKIPDVSFIPKGCSKHHKNGRRTEKIKRICRFESRINQVKV